MLSPQGSQLFAYESSERPMSSHIDLGSSPRRRPSLKKSFETTEASSIVGALQCASSPSSSSTQPQMQSHGNRAQYIGRKLAFWRKKSPSASHVHAKLHSLAKSHDRYHHDLKEAMNAMRDWAEYLSPPVLVTQNPLQHQMVDVAISQFTTSVLDTIQPIIDSERKAVEIHAALSHSFEAIRKEEADLNLILKKQCSAEKQYFKAKSSGWNQSEAERLHRTCAHLASDVGQAANRLRHAYRRELPVRVAQLQNLYGNDEKELARASQSLMRLLGSEARTFMNPIKEQTYSSSRTSSIYNSPSMVIEPLQTSRFPGLSPSNCRAAPQPTHEASTPVPEEEMHKRSLESQSDRRPLQLDIQGLGENNFLWS